VLSSPNTGSDTTLPITFAGSFILSPGKALTEPLFLILVISLVSLLLGLRRARPRKAVAVAIVALAALWALSTRVAAVVLIRSLLVHERSTVSPSVIVVAGAGSSPEGLSSTSEYRVTAGVRWWRRHPAALLVMAGADTLPDGISSDTAMLMRNEAIRRGVPPRSVTIDVRSRDTREHAIELAKRAGVTRATPVGVVTSEWHMRRALAAFRRHFQTVIAYPDEADYSERIIPGSFLPEAKSLTVSTSMLHEWIGIAWYAFRG
jgi:uncharacterized SAM-binding protein YcdF (DUF218 family)